MRQYLVCLVTLGYFLTGCASSTGLHEVTAAAPTAEESGRFPPDTGLTGTMSVAQGQPAAGSQVRLMFLFKGPGQERNAAVENTLTRVFQSHGYSVIDTSTVAQ